jgi:hypothetical protein
VRWSVNLDGLPAKGKVSVSVRAVLFDGRHGPTTRSGFVLDGPPLCYC